MLTLQSRLARLEVLASPSGPLLLPMRRDVRSLITVKYEGKEYKQAEDESREDFLSRVTASDPARTVVWMEELDEKL